MRATEHTSRTDPAQEEQLLVMCGEAFQNFHDQHWTCEFETNYPRRRRRSASEIETRVRCVNTLPGHREKGHQFPGASSRDGYTQVFGDFQSTFQRDHLNRHLKMEVNRLRAERDLPGLRASLVELAKATGLSKLRSNTTCYICFCRMPTHSLPCGHSFCGNCLQNLNENPDAQEEHIVILRNCPLHVSTENCELTFRLKPRNAGVRILTLDG